MHPDIIPHTLSLIATESPREPLKRLSSLFQRIPESFHVNKEMVAGGSFDESSDVLRLGQAQLLSWLDAVEDVAIPDGAGSPRLELEARGPSVDRLVLVQHLI